MIHPIRLWTLTWKETFRFLKVWTQTVGSPVVIAVMYFAVFGGALGSKITELKGVPYSIFIIPGLVLLQSTTNAFMNPSSSLVIAKYSGTMSDILLPPLSALEKTLGYMLGGLVRGLMVSVLIFIVAGLFTGQYIPVHWGVFIAMLILTNGVFALLGTLIGIWAKSFDQISGFTTFIITPMGFLGAIFYSLDMLPPLAQTLSLLNPFFYFADGLRYGFLGINEISPLISVGLTLGLFVMLFFLNWLAFFKNWRLGI
jgi:ABC-2 type transport system permease protein